MAVSKITPKSTLPKSTTSTMLYGKLPPQAPDIEAAVLGALMVEGNKLSDVIDILQTPECFYVDANKKIYAAIRRLFDKASPIDFMTVSEELKKTGELEIVGGYYYVTSLTRDVVSSSSIDTHARIILQKFIMRELIKQSGEVINAAYEDSTDVFQLLDTAETNLYDITNNHLRKSFKSIGDIVIETIKEIEEQGKRTDELTGIPSQFTELDKITGGWQKTDLIILAARPAVGKTAFALNLVMNAAIREAEDKGTAVAFFSLEMSAGQLVKRMLSAQTGVPLSKITKGNLADHEIVQLNKRMTKLMNAQIFIDDQAALNIFELRAKCRRLKQKHNLGFVVIDYLQLMTASMDKNGNREQEISKISRELKGLAKELEIPIVALSQLNRGVENRTGASKLPQLSDLRESGAIEQDADMVMFLFRPEYYKVEGIDATPKKGEENVQASVEGETWINIAKHRNGQTGVVKVVADLAYQKFNNMPESALKSFTDDGLGNNMLDDASKGIQGSYGNPNLRVDSIFVESKINDRPFDEEEGKDNTAPPEEEGDFDLF
jgi:replicative DNA helicase